MPISDKRVERRYARVARKLNRADGNQPKIDKINKKYGYDYNAAQRGGITPDETGHWPSRNPDTGQILKGRKHPTIRRTKDAEKKMGYKIENRKGTLYSFPKKGK